MVGATATLTEERRIGWGVWHFGREPEPAAWAAAERIEWSAGLHRMTGRRRTDGALALPDFADLAGPDDRGAVRNAILQLFDGLDSVEVEYLLSSRNRVRPVRAVFEWWPDRCTLHGTVEELTERDLLPAPRRTTEVNGVRVAVRYLSADADCPVGGDWYLTAPLPGGDLMLAVGDVMGHGLGAVGDMVELRHAMTDFALAGAEPGGVLALLNAMLCARPINVMATAVVGRYHAGHRTLTWACAGHLPILVADRNGVTTPDQPSGMMLGVDPSARYEQASVDLHRDDMVLMYTDGVVEERGRHIDESVDAFADQIREAIQAPPLERLGAVMGRARRRNPDDDACLLGAQPV